MELSDGPKQEARRWVFAALAWLGSVIVLAPVCFIAAIVLGGPHSSVLPSVLQPAVFVLGWVAFLALPLLIARAVFRRTGRGTVERAR